MQIEQDLLSGTVTLEQCLHPGQISTVHPEEIYLDIYATPRHKAVGAPPPPIWAKPIRDLTKKV